MSDTSNDGGDKGTVTIKWEDGTVETYTLPVDAVAGFTHNGNKITFRGFKVGLTDGLVYNYTFNFDKIRMYEKSWL